MNGTVPTRLYTLSLHDALPILRGWGGLKYDAGMSSGSERRQTAAWDPSGSTVTSRQGMEGDDARSAMRDRKSTRLNSSHVRISYAVFCLKKKRSDLKFATARSL